MEQFSYDLTIALEEETTRCNGSRAQRWGVRRRTRSTGNLPSAPQPTEDSSTSAENDAVALVHNHLGMALLELNNNKQFMLNQSASQRKNGKNDGSDDDTEDEDDLELNAKCLTPSGGTGARPNDPLGNNFESDSLNETTFSPARPCARRKRKFKRMAIEYETTTANTTPATTPGAPNVRLSGTAAESGGTSGMNTSPMGATKKVPFHLKQQHSATCQENYRANLFFCGKRKRSHRDRYDYDHHHHRQHSSSVPRHQRDMFPSRNSYMEFLNNRHRGHLSGSGCRVPVCQKIQPLHKTIVSKIERIAQDSSRTPRPECEFKPIVIEDKDAAEKDADGMKVGSLESNFSFQEYGGSCLSETGLCMTGGEGVVRNVTPSQEVIDGRQPKRGNQHRRHRQHQHHKRRSTQLQFDDPTFMECNHTMGSDMLSSSSLSSSSSSSDSEVDHKTYDSDREGDDELTDWPGNEAMINFASKNDFKRARSQRQLLKATTLPLIRSSDVADASDDGGTQDTVMWSGDETNVKPGFINSTSLGTNTGSSQSGRITPTIGATPTTPFNLPPVPTFRSAIESASGVGGAIRMQLPSSMPIDIATVATSSAWPLNEVAAVAPGPQIESEMSGETSNPFLSSPNAGPNEVREIRAGCRRVHEERPSFSIIASANEDLSKFLQDGKQMQLRLPDLDGQELEKLSHLAKLYSLAMKVDNGVAVLTKTSNTTQPVRVDRANISRRFLSDFKRRCYGDDEQQALKDGQPS